MTDQIVLLNPPLAAVLALVGLVKDVNFDVLLVVFGALKGPIAVGALVGVAKDVRLDVSGEVGV